MPTPQPLCPPGHLAHLGLIDLLQVQLQDPPSLAQKLSVWLFIACTIKSQLLNLGIRGLPESDPNTYLSLGSVPLPSWLVTALWTALAFPGALLEGLPS